jgi:SAM-dependent methyltransferase
MLDTDTRPQAETVYDAAFYADQQDGSLSSADIVVPLVLSLFPVRSVVDIGCGIGGWLSAFHDHGVGDYLGFDGDYVPRDLLKIPASRFRPTDLQALHEVGRRFDLACCLEVAEHLPAACAEQLVHTLVQAAPVVLFSAAIPFQGGTDHINEQWQSYWRELFARHGYVAVDCIRPAVAGDRRVEPWYRQNTLVYCEPQRCPPGHQPVADVDVDRVDPEMYERLLRPAPISGRQAARTMLAMLPIVARAALRRFGAAR